MDFEAFRTHALVASFGIDAFVTAAAIIDLTFVNIKACPVVLVKFEAPRTGTLWSIFGVYAFTVTSPVINLTRRYTGTVVVPEDVFGGT